MHLTGSGRGDSESFLRELVAILPPKGRRFLLPRSDIGRDVVPDGLRAAGAEVDAVEAYRNVPAQVDAERLRAISPLFHAETIRSPLLVIQGANDPRVLQVESDELVEAVRANQVPVDYVVFPDEGHGFVKTSNRITASEAYVSFLGKHL